MKVKWLEHVTIFSGVLESERYDFVYVKRLYNMNEKVAVAILKLEAYEIYLSKLHHDK